MANDCSTPWTLLVVAFAAGSFITLKFLESEDKKNEQIRRKRFERYGFNGKFRKARKAMK